MYDLGEKSSWSDADWPLTPEQDLAVFLAMTREVFLANRTNPLPAFEALGFIAAYCWEHDPEPDEVRVPFWAVEAIACAFKQYEHSHADPGGERLTFGKAFQVEGDGQGKRPRIHETLKQLRDIRVATMIVRLEEEGWKIEAAIQKVSDIAKLDHTTVRDIWSAWAERARSALRNFRRTSAPAG